MPEGLSTVDGKPVDLEAANKSFARAMSAPTQEELDIPGPPKREPVAETAEEDKPKRKAAKPAAKPRVKPVQPVKADYTQEAQEFVANAWLVAAVIPYTSPYAVVIDGSKASLVPALAEGAKHNESIRQWVAGTSEHAWKAQLTIALVQMSLQSLTIARDPELKKQAEETTREQLAAMLGTVKDAPDGSAAG